MGSVNVYGNIYTVFPYIIILDLIIIILYTCYITNLEGNILKNNVEILVSSLSELNNRLVSILFVKPNCKFTLTIKQCNSFIDNAQWHIEDKETHNTCEFNIDDIKDVQIDVFADYWESTIYFNDGAFLLVNTN